MLFRTLIQLKEILIVTFILGILFHYFSEELLAVPIFGNKQLAIDFDIDGLFWLGYLLALLSILIKYIQEKCLKKNIISLLSLSSIIFIGFGQIVIIEWWWSELFYAHSILTIISIIGLFIYIFTKKYYWWLIFSPALTMSTMYILEEFYPCLKPIGLGAA